MSGVRRGIGAVLVSCVATAVAAGLCGCAVIGERYVLVEQFTEEQARTIRNGETTKKEVLDRLGPPASVARPGAADNVLRRFAAAGATAKDRIVYRYDASALTWSDFCVYGQGGGGCIPFGLEVREQGLWILIDEASGRVVDHALEVTTRGDDTVEVRPWLGP